MSDAANTRGRSVLLIGGKSAGKSNYLFRLWNAIDSGKGALSKDGLPAELTYLDTGASALLSGTFAGRTAPESLERVVIPVKATAGGASGELVVPDAPGEQFLQVYRARRWSAAWEELISENCGCLLFVRTDADENVTPLDWATCYEKLGATVEEHAIGDQREPPTQVLLTEWLQFLRNAFTAVVGGAFNPRIGIVISAWDMVPADQQASGPGAWLKANFPMLYQFVMANRDAFEFEIFGVSVVSGDLQDPEFRKKYLGGNPDDFGSVVHQLTGALQPSQDICLPAAWALRFI